MPQSSSSDSSARKPVGPRSEPSKPTHVRFWTRGVDSVAFSNGLPAAIAAGLSLAASEALDVPKPWHWALLAASGTFVVYGLDRLRDRDRDRASSPLRTRFVEAHARAIAIVVVIATLVVGATLISAPTSVVLLCLGVGAIGLLHRRLKGHATLKSMYVSVAWVAICAGIPAIIVWNGPRFAWVGAIYFAALAANLIGSNLIDSNLIRNEVERAPRRPGSELGLALALTFAGIVLAAAAPHELRPLGWIPLSEALALAWLRPTEHYGHLAVDGALLAGAVGCLLHFGLV